MVADRVTTGIKGLDSMIGGGFPRCSLILLAGNPGTGKTVFGAQFISRGVHEYGEPRIYVSFSEGKEVLIQNISKHIGVKPESWGDKCRVLDFSTMKKVGIADAMNMVFSAVQEVGDRQFLSNGSSLQGAHRCQDHPSHHTQ